MKTVKTIPWILTLLLALAIFLQRNKVNTLQEQLNTVTTELEQTQAEKPETIIVHDTKIEYKYRDGKTVTKEVVPEGYVKFDMGKYNSLQVKADSLTYSRQILLSKIEAAKKDSLNQAATIETYNQSLADVEKELARVLSELKKPDSFVTIKTRGLTFRPTVGIGYNGSVSPYAGVKIGYWGKYGLQVGTTDKQAGIGVSRRLYDYIPYLHNTEIMLMGGLPYQSGDGHVFVGLGVGL